MTKAPNFTLPNQDGIPRTLKDYAGKWLVLYFYPKDDTPGCTKEACSFRDEREVIAELTGAEVVGISRDTIGSHKRFIDKYDLNFELLSDRDHAVAEAFGAWGMKKFTGREFIGALRNTYLINPEGQIVKAYEGVTPKDHAAEIINDLKQLVAKG